MDALLKPERMLSCNQEHLFHDFSALMRTNSATASLSLVRFSSEHSAESGEIDVYFSVPENPRRITLAKQILAEATDSFDFSSCRQHNNFFSDSSPQTGRSQRNTGAIGPLLSLLSCSSDIQKVQNTLDTLAFMVLDASNRSLVLELEGIDVVLCVLERLPDPSVVTSALGALVPIVRDCEALKCSVWAHSAKRHILHLLQNKCVSPLTFISLMEYLVPLAFQPSPLPGSSLLLEPLLVPILVDAFSSDDDEALTICCLNVLTEVCKCKHVATHVSSWELCVTKVVPLLSTACMPSVCHAAATWLLQLTDQNMCHAVVYRSGCLSAVLSLLLRTDLGINRCAAQILGALAESGVAPDDESVEQALASMVHVLQCGCDAEVSVATLYTMSRLVGHDTGCAHTLRACSAPSVLMSLLESSSDEDIVLGALHVLDQLGWAQGPQAAAAGLAQRGAVCWGSASATSSAFNSEAGCLSEGRLGSTSAC